MLKKKQSMKGIVKIILTTSFLINRSSLIRAAIVMALVLNSQFLIIHAQVGINDDNSSPDASAMLDVKSTAKGMLVPRMTTSQRDLVNSPATGLMIYNTSTKVFNFYNGIAWIAITAGNIKELTDADNDTKIQVEESADEDIIRFDIAGTEYMTLSDGHLSFENNGESVFIGKNAGINDDKVNNYNVFIGADAGTTNTSGTFNTFIGNNAGNKNTTGLFNSFIGAYAGNKNTTGSSNTFTGVNTGVNNTTGGNNTFYGVSSGLKNTTGSNNTFTGYQAGFNNVSGASNVFLGYQAGYNETGSNKLYIDNSNTTTPLIHGDFSTDILKINGTLGIKDVYTFPIVDGTSGQVLSTNGAGAVTWQSIVSPTATLIADADANTKVEAEQTSNDDLIRLSIAGTETFRFTGTRLEFFTGTDIRIGENAGYAIPTNRNNLIIGKNSGASAISIMNNNLVIGNNSLDVASGSPDENVIIGHDAFLPASGQLMGGDQNVIIGRYATGNIQGTIYHNIAIGYGSMQNITGTGNNSYNIAIGSNAMANFSGSYQNIAIGNQALRNATGSLVRKNIAIGSFAGRFATGSDNIYIGDYAGENNTGTANVFIGHDAGRNETGSNLLYVENTNSATPLIWGDFANDKVGINRVATTNTLEVGGAASKASAGSWVANSDARLKKNIIPLSSEKMLNDLLALRGVTYEWNDTTTGNQRPIGIQYGFTAQNIQEVFPTLVEEDNQGYLQTAYGTYDAMTIEAIRALNDKIERLEKENEHLKTQVAKVEKLEAILLEMQQPKMEAELSNE